MYRKIQLLRHNLYPCVIVFIPSSNLMLIAALLIECALTFVSSL